MNIQSIKNIIKLLSSINYILLLIALFSGFSYSQDPLAYEILREYKGNNDFYKSFIYLDTNEKIDTSNINNLLEKYNIDHPNKFSNKAFFLYHKNTYYSTILEKKNRANKVTVVIDEYIQDEAVHKSKIDLQILKTRNLRKMNPKDSIICYCKNAFNPYVKGKIIYQEWYSGEYKLPNLNDISVKLETEKYYRQFSKYGDTNQDVYTLYFSNPYKETPYHSLHYINDFGDMVIKKEGEKGVLSVCKRINK